MRFLIEARRCSPRKISQLPRLSGDNLRVLEIRRCSPVSFYLERERDGSHLSSRSRSLQFCIDENSTNYKEGKSWQRKSYPLILWSFFTLFSSQSYPLNLLRCSLEELHYSSGILESQMNANCEGCLSWKDEKNLKVVCCATGSSYLRNEICIWGDISL